MQPHSIYALCEPGTETVRYVGRTARSAKVRHYEHVRLTIRMVRRGSRTKRAPLYQWLESLIEARQYPEVIILAECPGEKSVEAEQAWIDALCANGYDLLNVAPPRRITRDPLLSIEHNTNAFPQLDRNMPSLTDSRLLEGVSVSHG